MHAPRTTTISGTVADQLVAGGSPIKVYGMMAINGSSVGNMSAFVRIVGNSTTDAQIIGEVVVNTDPVIIDVPFIADQGLVVDITGTAATKTVVIFHGHPGA